MDICYSSVAKKPCYQLHLKLHCSCSCDIHTVQASQGLSLCALKRDALKQQGHEVSQMKCKKRAVTREQPDQHMAMMEKPLLIEKAISEATCHEYSKCTAC